MPRRSSTSSNTTIVPSAIDHPAGHHPQQKRPDSAASARSPFSSSTTPSSATHKRNLSTDVLSPAESNASPNYVGDSAGNQEDQRPKKRRAGPGSRSVNTLTPEQLKRKRANDRQAQRAIRERNKNLIEDLQNQVLELESQEYYKEFKRVEAENADLKARLAAIMAQCQGVLGSLQAGEGVYPSPVPAYVPAQHNQQPSALPPTQYSSTPPSTASPFSVEPSWNQTGMQNGGSPMDPSSSFNQVRLITQQRQNSIHALDFAPGEQLNLDFLLDPTLSARAHHQRIAGPNDVQDAQNFNNMQLRGGLSVLSNRPGSLAPQQQQQQGQQQGQQQHQRLDYAADTKTNQSAEPWAGNCNPVNNCPPTCILDRLLLDFLQERHQRAAEGVSAQDIIGPRYPSVSSLLNPASSAASHPLSKVFTDILAAFPAICTLPERVAVLCIMFFVMRWQISPTKENYDLLPSWAHPTPSQSSHPHPAWMDHLPFPAMREKLAKDYATAPESSAFVDFFVPFTNTLSLNWPYEETDVLLAGADGGEFIVNPVFDRHMRRISNWTLGEEFHQTFPHLDGTYNFKRDGSARGNVQMK